ncbi:MAG: T9SS type A sorting domain-containing protein [Bacteroidota bacterium]
MEIKKLKKKFRKKIPPIPLGMILVCILSLFYSGITAQITTGFELDGNAVSVIPNPPDDWDKVYNGTSSAQVSTGVVSDIDNIFQGGGSKDDLDLNNWGWTLGSVPDKDNILHGGVALYDNCKLYFFADRYATNGSANIGFWLFKDNVSVLNDGTFSGIHTIGDLLLVSEFVNGGGTSIIKAYKWVGSGGSDGTLDEVTVNGTNSYAITNTASIPSPWPFIPKTGAVNQFGPGAFFEGGIDLCNIAGLDPCFTSFLIETRASFEVNAVLKDFMNGSFNSTPQISLTGGTRCIDGSGVTLAPTVTGGIYPYTFLWSPGGSTDSTITVSPAVPTTYTFTVTGLNGCTNSATATVTVSSLPNVNAGTDKVINCTSPTVALSGSSSTVGVNFSWTTIGGNIVSGGTTATPTVDAGGTYILTVTNPSTGCTAKDTAMVSSNKILPNVSAGIDKNLTCLVTSVSLNGSSTTAGVTFSWTTIGGNILSGGSTATPTVNAAGTYILTVTNPVNGCIAKDTAMVMLNNTLPNVNAGIDKTLTCTTTSLSLSGSSSTSGAVFSWATIGGNIVSGGATATPTVDAAGTYILTVTAPINGCFKKDTAMVMLDNALPNVNAGVDTVINCLHTSISLNGSSQTLNAVFSWTTTDGNIVSGAATAHPTVNAGGTYVLTVTNPLNGCMKSDTVIVIMDITTPDVNAGPDKTLTCTATQVMLNGSSTTLGVTFTWTASNGGVIFSGGNTATPIVQIPGTYILTVTNPVNGCTAMDSADVFQDISAPDVDAGIDKTLTCTITSISLSGTSLTPGTTYNWTTIDGNIVSGVTTLTPTVNAAGTYVLTVTNTISGCQASDVAVVILNNTLPNVNAGIDKTLTCTTTSLSLSGSSSTSGAIFSWATIGGNIVSGGATATPTVNAAGTYILTVTDPINGCFKKDTAMVMLDNALPNVNAGVDTVINCLHTSISLNGSSQTLNAVFSWTTTDGNIVSGAATAHPTVNAGGTYVLTVTNPVNGCMKSDTVIVIMDITTPNVNAGPDKTLTCLVTQVMLNGSSTTQGVTFAWIATNGGVIFSGGNTATPIVQIPGTYILTVTNPVNGCTAMDSADVFQDVNTPNANAGIDKVLNCTVTSIVLNGASTTIGANFSWTTTNGNIVSGATTLTPTVNAAGTYVLTVTNPNNGCMAMDSAVVTLDNLVPNVNAGADDMLTCIISFIQLNGLSTTVGANYSWTTTNGNILLGANTAMPTVNAAGTYVLTVTNPVNGCTAKDTAMVMLDNTLPNVNAGADTVINCLHTSIALNGSSQTLNAVFSWTTTDGNIVSGASTTNPVVNAGGTYVLTVTNPVNGCMATDTVTVMMDITPPNVNAGSDKTLTCVVTQVTLNGSSTTQGVTFQWIATNGGVILSGANTATPLVQIPGTYILTVVNPVNGCTAMDSADVFYDNSKPDVDAGIDMMLNCSVLSTVLDGSSSTSGATAMWTALVGGNIVSGAATFNPTVDMAGTYILTVTHPTSGCTAVDTAIVTVNITVPNVNAGVDTVIGCGVATVTLYGSSTSSVGYNWTTIGGHIASGATTANPIVDAAGMYILTVIDHINGCSAKDTVIVNLSIPPVVDLGIDISAVFCVGHVTLDAGNPGLDYLWSTGATTQTIDVSGSGAYYVTVTNSFNCSDSDTINVTIIPGTFDVDLGNDTTFMNCHALTLTLDAGVTDAIYLWSTTETTQTITISTSGVYFVNVTDTLGCMASDTINVTVIDNNIDVDLGPDTTLCSCIVLSAEIPGATYLWCSDEEYPEITVCQTGTYCVTVSNGTCIDSDTIHVTINPPPVVNLGNDTILVSGTLTLDAGNPGASYLWNTGATSQTLIVTESGQYYVTITDVFGCTASDTINVNVTIGINENASNNLSMSVYPNPSSDKSFTLSFNVLQKTNVEIRILNVLGKVVYSEKLSNFSGHYQKLIDLKDIAGGIYFTELLNGTTRSTAKIILE